MTIKQHKRRIQHTSYAPANKRQQQILRDLLDAQTRYDHRDLGEPFGGQKTPPSPPKSLLSAARTQQRKFTGEGSSEDRNPTTATRQIPQTHTTALLAIIALLALATPTAQAEIVMNDIQSPCHLLVQANSQQSVFPGYTGDPAEITKWLETMSGGIAIGTVGGTPYYVCGQWTGSSAFSGTSCLSNGQLFVPSPTAQTIPVGNNSNFSLTLMGTDPQGELIWMLLMDYPTLQSPWQAGHWIIFLVGGQITDGVLSGTAIKYAPGNNDTPDVQAFFGSGAWNTTSQPTWGNATTQPDQLINEDNWESKIQETLINGPDDGNGNKGWADWTKQKIATHPNLAKYAAPILTLYNTATSQPSTPGTAAQWDAWETQVGWQTNTQANGIAFNGQGPQNAEIRPGPWSGPQNDGKYNFIGNTSQGGNGAIYGLVNEFCLGLEWITSNAPTAFEIIRLASSGLMIWYFLGWAFKTILWGLGVLGRDPDLIGFLKADGDAEDGRPQTAREYERGFLDADEAREKLHYENRRPPALHTRQYDDFHTSNHPEYDWTDQQ